MKKALIILFSICAAIGICLYTSSCKYHKVFKIESPLQIYIDENNNLIFDEKTPFIIDNIIDINSNNAPLLKQLSENQKFIINFLQKEYADKLLKNKFVHINNNKIYIGKNEYSKLLLDSHLFFDETENSQKEFIEEVNKINIDDYIILNTRTKKYHLLNCETVKKIRSYKIIKKNYLPYNASPCENCILEKQKETDIENKVTYSNKDYISQNIKIFFLDLNTIYKPNSKCSSTACRTLKEEINKAEKTIDFSIYGISKQPDILNALIDAKKRGVKIRWVCDNDENGYYKNTKELQKHIPTYKTDEEYDKTHRPAIMHNKFFIFDGHKVWSGSSNITNTELTGFNANYSVLIDNKEIAEVFTKEFSQLYSGKFHTEKEQNTTNTIKIDDNTKIKALFSPQDKIIEKEIIPIILNAKQYIYIPIFFLTYKNIEEALIKAHNNGVEIKIIIDATNAYSKYTIHKRLRQAGIKVKTENYAGKMHAKTIIVDNAITIIGSMNYTKSAEERNDENIIIIYDHKIAEFMKGTFLYLWNKIPDKYEVFDPKAESFESIGSCYDGIDNDYDGKIDNFDEGCIVK